MSQISQKSISGITSITTPTGIDNQFTLHINDTSEALKLDHAGNIHIHNHVNTTGISSASNFKTGTSDLHSAGLNVAYADVDDFVDVGSNIKLGNAGVITATSFVGDGSDLTNLPAGLGTALSATASSPLNKMYYTNQVLGVPSSVTVDVPASASKAYTQYADIKVDGSADLIVAEGDDLIPDVLGLADFGTFGGGASAGRIRVNSISNAAANGATTIQNGVVISGMTTITGGLSIGGTITYEDVTNIDSIGIITARSGVDVDDFVSVGSNIHLGNAGIITATSYRGDGSQLTGIVADKIFEGNTEVETIDTGSDGHIKFTTEGNEKLRIQSDEYIWVNKGNANNNAQFVLDKSASGGAGVRFYNAGSQLAYIQLDASEDMVHYGGSGVDQIFYAGLYERLRIISNGRIGINTTSATSALQIYAADLGEGTAKGQIFLKDNADYNATPTGGIVFQGHHTSGKTSQAIFAGIRGFKANTGDGDYDGCLGFDVRKHGAVAYEAMRINEYGTITNTTDSSHSQGAGTFNIKGVINQYSQGSGSGLIFDCDFGRLTGYSDNGGIANSANLSAALAHSTTDWTSSSSNTPMTVNGGSFNYRVGRGGYLDCVSNEGRVQIAGGAGGSPNIAEVLNTPSMTIESWIWYDGAGREVIVSRYGSGFPNQFNMIADPDGQFHYNNSGVGAGSGNITGQNFPDKTWHHHVWQYDSGNNVNRWYINGAFANSASAGSSLAVVSTAGFAIASRGDDYERWDGKIAVVRIYNRALSATEIKNHFELDRGRFGV
jgi:hypothetical protein